MRMRFAAREHELHMGVAHRRAARCLHPVPAGVGAALRDAGVVAGNLAQPAAHGRVLARELCDRLQQRP